MKTIPQYTRIFYCLLRMYHCSAIEGHKLILNHHLIALFQSIRGRNNFQTTLFINESQPSSHHNLIQYCKACDIYGKKLLLFTTHSDNERFDCFAYSLSLNNKLHHFGSSHQNHCYLNCLITIKKISNNNDNEKKNVQRKSVFNELNRTGKFVYLFLSFIFS